MQSTPFLPDFFACRRQRVGRSTVIFGKGRPHPRTASHTLHTLSFNSHVFFAAPRLCAAGWRRDATPVRPPSSPIPSSLHRYGAGGHARQGKPPQMSFFAILKKNEIFLITNCTELPLFTLHPAPACNIPQQKQVVDYKHFTRLTYRFYRL